MKRKSNHPISLTEFRRTFAPSALAINCEVASDWPEDVSRALGGLAGAGEEGVQVVVVANAPSDDIEGLFEQQDVSALRPDVVWFGEMLPEGAFERAGRAVHDADLLLIIGTSGVVFPAAGLVSFHDGLSIEINPQLSAVSSACTFAIAATAAEATPPLVEAIIECRN